MLFRWDWQSKTRLDVLDRTSEHATVVADPTATWSGCTRKPIGPEGNHNIGVEFVEQM